MKIKRILCKIVQVITLGYIIDEMNQDNYINFYLDQIKFYRAKVINYEIKAYIINR